MSIASISTYATGNLYYKINEAAEEAAKDAAKETAEELTSGTEESGSTSEDRVTFSSDLTLAQTREAMGLEPTGKLKLKDLESVAQDRENVVTSTLEQTMQSLGIEFAGKIVLSMNSDDEIEVSGDFSGKDALEDALNEDEAFVTAFKQLSANQSILDHMSELQANVQTLQTTGLSSFFDSDSDTGFDSLLSLADEYESLKGSNKNIKRLLNLSSSENSYSYTYNPTSDDE